MALPYDLLLQLNRTRETLEVHSFAAGNFCVAQPDAEFTIVLRNRTSQRVAFELYVDGKKVESKRIGPNRTSSMVGWPVDDHTCRAFVFSPPPTFDASMAGAPLELSSAGRAKAVPASSGNLNALGEVRAVIWPTYERSQVAVRKPFHSACHHRQMAVPEDKKAVALGVTTGAGTTLSDHRKALSKNKTDKSRGPLGTVTLRYCVPDALRLSPDASLKAVGEALVSKAASIASSSAASSSATCSSAASSSAASSSAAAPPPRRPASLLQSAAAHAAAPSEGARRPKREAPSNEDADPGVDDARPHASKGKAKRSAPEVIDLT
eukprot:scaffold32214_cov61-Phaeocystis_antarctica.AAC.6